MCTYMYIIIHVYMGIHPAPRYNKYLHMLWHDIYYSYIAQTGMYEPHRGSYMPVWAM